MDEGFEVVDLLTEDTRVQKNIGNGRRTGKIIVVRFHARTQRRNKNKDRSGKMRRMLRMRPILPP